LLYIDAALGGRLEEEAAAFLRERESLLRSNLPRWQIRLVAHDRKAEGVGFLGVDGRRVVGEGSDITDNGAEVEKGGEGGRVGHVVHEEEAVRALDMAFSPQSAVLRLSRCVHELDIDGAAVDDAFVGVLVLDRGIVLGACQDTKDLLRDKWSSLRPQSRA
jgi:hypothetical protein